jgi:hypothetical protein
MEVVLAQGTAPLSRLIMWATKGSYSHTALRYGGVEDEWMVHAFIYGVVPEWSSYFFAHYPKTKRFKVIRFEKKAEEALDAIVQKYRHRAYDYGSLVGAALVMLLGRVGIHIKNPLGSRRAFMCTELVGEWLNEFIARSGACLPTLDSSSLTPVMIELMLGANPDYFRVLDVPSQAHL